MKTKNQTRKDLASLRNDVGGGDGNGRRFNRQSGQRINGKMRKWTAGIISCYQCGKLGHKAPDCNLRFDVQSCTVDELQSFLEDRLAELDVVAAEDDATVEEDRPKVQDFADSNE